MGSRPLVSAIVTTHGTHRPFLRDALRSVVAQDYPNVEILVADNGGSDLGELRREFDQVRFLDASGVPACAGAPRNYAAARCHGEYLAFLDHDDCWYPTKLTRQVHLLEGNPSMGISFTQFELLDDETGRISAGYGGPCTYLGLLGGEIRNYPSSLMVRRATFEDLGGFSEDTRITEDIEFSLRACRLAPAGFVEEVLLRHRVHEGSMTSRWRMPYRGTDLVLRAHGREAEARGDRLAARTARRGRRAVRPTYGRLAYQEFRAAVQAGAWTSHLDDLVWALRLDPRGTLSSLGAYAAERLHRPRGHNGWTPSS